MKNLLLIFIAFTLFGCDFISENNNLNDTETKWKPDTFILFREVNDGSTIMMQRFVNGKLDPSFDKSIVLDSTKGKFFLTDGLIQCTADKNLVYITCFKKTTCDRIFNWFKLYEYNFKNNSFREITEIDFGYSYWYFCEINHTIYYYDQGYSFISLNLDDNSRDTIYTSKLSFEKFRPSIVDYKTLQFIAFEYKTGVYKLLIDLRTNEVQTEYLFYARKMSDYRSGKVIEVNNNFRSGPQEIGIRNKDGLIKLRHTFDIWNAFWLSDCEFVIADVNKLIKLNLELEVIDKIELTDVFIEFRLDNCLLISYSENEIKKIGLLSFDFKELVEIESLRGVGRHDCVNAIVE